MFGLISTVIVGFIVGVIAKLIMPGKENLGFVMTALLGIVGSVVATYAGQMIGWYQAWPGRRLDRLDHRRLRGFVGLLEVQKQSLA